MLLLKLKYSLIIISCFDQKKYAAFSIASILLAIIGIWDYDHSILSGKESVMKNTEQFSIE